MRKVLGLISVALVLAGCAPSQPAADESTVEASAWTCVSDEGAFGELRALCGTSAEYLEGEIVFMQFHVFCSRENADEPGYIISKFRSSFPGGRSVEFLRAIDVSIDGGPKIRAEWSGFDAKVLEGEPFGSFQDGSFQHPHKFLDDTESLIIRASIEPTKTPTTSVFEWGDWSEPKAFLEAAGCTWDY